METLSEDLHASTAAMLKAKAKVKNQHCLIVDEVMTLCNFLQSSDLENDFTQAQHARAIMISKASTEHHTT